MIVTTPVAPGTAENLARVAHFRDLAVHDDGTAQPDAPELDAVALHLLGDVGPAHKALELWAELRAHDCARLWHLITDDWDDRDLDDPCDEDAALTREQEEEARHERTVARLTWDIEARVWRARYDAAETRRAEARRAHRADVEARIHPVDAAMRRHPAGSRLDGSQRLGGGDPLADYLYLKGEL